MSLYGNKIKIGGVTCGLVMRGVSNGRYLAVFEREFASLEQIEAIKWDPPTVEGDTILPAGYGFEVKRIEYDMGTRSYTVHLRWRSSTWATWRATSPRWRSFSRP